AGRCRCCSRLVQHATGLGRKGAKKPQKRPPWIYALRCCKRGIATCNRRQGGPAVNLGRCLRPAKLAKAARASSSKLERAPAAQLPATARRPGIASPTTSHR